MTFNEFAKILENALLPPVLKNTKKVKIKIKEFDQQSNKDYISDLDKLVNKYLLLNYKSAEEWNMSIKWLKETKLLIGA